LLNRRKGCRGKHGIARDKSEIRDVSVLVDQGLQNNLPFNAGLSLRQDNPA